MKFKEYILYNTSYIIVVCAYKSVNKIIEKEHEWRLWLTYLSLFCDFISFLDNAYNKNIFY